MFPHQLLPLEVSEHFSHTAWSTVGHRYSMCPALDFLGQSSFSISCPTAVINYAYICQTTCPRSDFQNYIQWKKNDSKRRRVHVSVLVVGVGWAGQGGGLTPVTSTLLPILGHTFPVPEGHSCDSIPGGTGIKREPGREPVTRVSTSLRLCGLGQVTVIPSLLGPGLEHIPGCMAGNE